MYLEIEILERKISKEQEIQAKNAAELIKVTTKIAQIKREIRLHFLFRLLILN